MERTEQQDLALPLELPPVDLELLVDVIRPGLVLGDRGTLAHAHLLAVVVATLGRGVVEGCGKQNGTSPSPSRFKLQDACVTAVNLPVVTRCPHQNS